MKYYATFENGFIASVRHLYDDEYERIKTSVLLTEISADVASAFATYRSGRCGLTNNQLVLYPDSGSKELKWAQIKQARAKEEYAGFTWNSTIFDSDVISQNRITGAVMLAQMAIAGGQPYSIEWTLKDNTVRTLTAQDMLAVGTALGAHVQTQFSKGQALRAQIEAATTQAEVEAISW